MSVTGNSGRSTGDGGIPPLDGSQVDEILSDRNQENPTSQLQGDQNLDFLEVTAEDDRELLMVQLDYSQASWVGSAGAKNPDDPSGSINRVQMTTRNDVADPVRAGVLWERLVQSQDGMLYEDETNSAGGAGGGDQTTFSVWVIPSRMPGSAPQILSGGQSLRVHLEVFSSAIPNSTTSGQLTAYLGDEE